MRLNAAAIIFLLYILYNNVWGLCGERQAETVGSLGERGKRELALAFLQSAPALYALCMRDFYLTRNWLVTVPSLP